MNQQQLKQLFDFQADALGEVIGDIRLGDFHWNSRLEIEIRKALKAGHDEWQKSHVFDDDETVCLDDADLPDPMRNVGMPLDDEAAYDFGEAASRG